MTTLVELIRETVYAGNSDFYSSSPGIVESFDESKQTVTVQLAIKVKNIKTKKYEKIAPIVDVPIILPATESYVLTMPINKGDEVLVVFSDSCIDNWFEKGKVSEPAEERMHNISDGFALFGVNSSPRTIMDYVTDAVELRNRNRNQYLSMKENGSTQLVAPTLIEIQSGTGIVHIKTTSSGQILMSVNGNNVLDLGPDSGKVTGDLWTTGDIRADGPSAFNSAGNAISTPNGDIVINLIRFLSHIHDASGAISGFTGPPINPEDT